MALIMQSTNLLMQTLDYLFVWRKMLGYDKDPALYERLITWQFFCIFSQLVVFAVMQKRELKQFFSYQEQKKKKEQLTTIFDAQSDAVIVVGQDAKQQQESQQEYELVEQKLPDFLFSNNKSKELFDYDLQNLKLEERQKADRFLDE